MADASPIASWAWGVTMCVTGKLMGVGCHGVCDGAPRDGIQWAKANPTNSWAWGVTVCVTGPHATAHNEPV